MSEFLASAASSAPAPEFHEVCGHYHFEGEGCPEQGESCGSFLCCQS